MTDTNSRLVLFRANSTIAAKYQAQRAVASVA
jgi:hypothetical protein